ncbi:macrolide family glycosyltransferase [Saccharothrix deserti]|uniref:macrolide family glycosyltransferase n=1 Tax=Saccharothrix deserti TaxID=2593674 RepID=UPI00131D1DD8|nr:macrolide family glycosyltransferase [Saccharothrix deserti]
MSEHYLFLTVPDRGHVFPNLAVVEELVRRGNRVTYVTAPSLADRVEAAGAEFLPYESEYEDIDNKLENFNKGHGLHVLMLVVDESAAMLRAVESHFGDERPDLVVYDVVTSHAGRILERKWGVPAVQTSPLFAQNEKFNFGSSFDDQGETEQPDMTPWVGKIMGLLGQHGLQVPFDEFFMKPADFTVVYVPREFQPFGESFDERFAFVGPCVGDRSFLQPWQPPETDLPIVLMSLGTLFNDLTDLFRVCVEAFTDAPLHAVISVGQATDPAAFGELPPNIEVHRWVAHLDVLEHAKAFVNHGGMGSVLECLSVGRPMVVMPLGPVDRPTGKQVEQLGLGRMIPPAEVTPELLRQTVLEVVEADLDENLARMRQSIERAGGTTRAVNEIEGYLKRRR